MLTITAVSTGAVEYLLRGSGCAEHEHAEKAGQKRGLDGAGYMLAGAEKEPAGVWFGTGLEDMLGIEVGTTATEEQVRAVLGRLEHPTKVDKDGDPLSLGSRPRKFRSREDRVKAALVAEPDATEERKEQIRNQVRADTRKAVAYYDLTFSPVKSVSVYWATLVAAGRTAEAANVIEAHRIAVAEAMAYVEREAGFVRSGYHGKTASGRSVGMYEATKGLSWIRWDHSTNRDQQPQLHSHVTLVNRAETSSDGEIRALDGKGFRPIKQGADAIYRQAYERVLTESNQVVFATRADGKAREIMGYGQQLLGKASSRRRDIAKAVGTATREFSERYGRAPSPVERKSMDRVAWRDTRAPKNLLVAPGQQLRNWVLGLRGELERALAAAEKHGERVARFGHPEQRGYAGRSREEVLLAAVEAVQVKYATWEVGNLVDEIAAQQTKTPLVAGAPADLANEVLRGGARYGVVLLTAPDPAPVPEALQREDGKSCYRPHNQEWWTTDTQLHTEATIVARAREQGAPTVDNPGLELARVELIAAGLSPDQQAAVLEILSSGRRGDVLIGPAGAGKSRTVGALARTWEANIGGRVLGLATSQIATQVLAEDGLHAVNTTVFLNRFTPDEHGQVRDHIRAGDLVVIDEAGMSSSNEVDAITQLVVAGGGKFVCTGDHEQLASVDAGGVLELLVRDNGAQQLTEIHRFHHQWERDASVRLRAGDPDVLAEYAAHGRIRGGTEQDMTAAAVRGYLADVLDGHSSLLVVRDNDTASALSGQIRAELVAAGRVGAEVLGEARDGNLIGVGDLLQARRNNQSIRVDGRGMVTNREVYEVLGANPLHGTLVVRDKHGLVAHLPRDYVAQDTTLAYAVTSYAAQGVTTYSSHDLVDRNTSKAGLYVPATRGRDCNTLYVVCEQEPDHHTPERLDRAALDVLADILTRPVEGAVAAELARRDGIEEGKSLAWVGTQWDLLTGEYGRDRYTDALTAMLGNQRMDQVVDEPGYGRLMSAVRGMELAGHDPAAVLVAAVNRGSLGDANSISDVLRHRVGLLETEGRRPEREVAHGQWGSFTTPIEGPVGRYADALAAAATERQLELGARAAADPPAWALEAPTLGTPPPEDNPRERDEWVRRAGIVATYRDLHAIPDEQLSIGGAPDRGREFHHALWRQAQAALGHPADVLDYAAASDGELRAMRDAWRREQSFAPEFVGPELAAARELAEDYRRDVVIWRAGLDQHQPGSSERDHAGRDLAAAEQLAAVYAARVAALSEVQAVREDWFTGSRDVRERARFAGDELERRGQDRDPVTPTVEQGALFDIAGQEPSETRARSHHGRAIDPAQQQFDLDGVPSAGRVDTAVNGPGQVRDQHQAGTGRGRAETPAEVETSVPAAYQKVFTDTDRAAEQARHQPPLFPVSVAPADIAAAEPVQTPPHGASSGVEPSATDTRGKGAVSDQELVPDVTVGEAARNARIIAGLRAELDARASAPPPAGRAPSDIDDEFNIGAPTPSDQHEQVITGTERADRSHGLRR